MFSKTKTCHMDMGFFLAIFITLLLIFPNQSLSQFQILHIYFQSWIHKSEGVIYCFVGTAILHNCINLKLEIKPSCRYNSIHAPKTKLFQLTYFWSMQIENLKFCTTSTFCVNFTMFSPWHNMLERKKLLKSHFDMIWISCFLFLFTLQTYEP
jgi:hypothetical protein